MDIQIHNETLRSCSLTLVPPDDPTRREGLSQATLVDQSILRSAD